jgi:hypothetical protein
MLLDLPAIKISHLVSMILVLIFAKVISLNSRNSLWVKLVYLFPKQYFLHDFLLQFYLIFYFFLLLIHYPYLYLLPSLYAVFFRYHIFFEVYLENLQIFDYFLPLFFIRFFKIPFILLNFFYECILLLIIF